MIRETQISVRGVRSEYVPRSEDGSEPPVFTAEQLARVNEANALRGLLSCKLVPDNSLDSGWRMIEVHIGDDDERIIEIAADVLCTWREMEKEIVGDPDKPLGVFKLRLIENGTIDWTGKKNPFSNEEIKIAERILAELIYQRSVNRVYHSDI